MSQQVRTSNLFAAEQWDTVYKSFKDVDFRAYDYDSIKQSLIDYIKAYYPEDFNDYIESSEYIAIIELLAWLGTSLAFRVDLNSRENFLDTAERRESVIRLARMLSYQPKRNIACDGVFKIVGVETTQPLIDSFGRSLENVTVFWNDPNNPDSFDQFIQILNNAFISSNPFGRPVKDGKVGGIKTSLYQMNDVTGINVAHKLSISVNNENLPFEVVNADFNDGENIFERHPDPNNAMHMLYRNDGQGFSSSNTGFFFHFKQGTLTKQDNRFDFPKQNRVVDVDFNNINNNDVWVQEINQDGDVQVQWKKVPSVVGNNIAYNDIPQNEREIFSVISGLDDTIQIKYSDGNLGKVPTGIFRTWFRTSVNKSFIMRPDEARDLEISLPYVAKDKQTYQLRLIFQLENSVANSFPSETNEEIKERAPRVYYSQDRMVNGQDYNVYPLSFGNQIKKLKTINRTHAGHSRFIDINDPTGTYSKVILFGEDGSLFKDPEQFTNFEVVITDPNNIENLVNVNLQNFILSNDNLSTWFYDEYVTAYERHSSYGNTVFNLPRGRQSNPHTYYKTKPDTYRNDTGYFTGSTTDPFTEAIAIGVPTPTGNYEDFEFLKEGAYFYGEYSAGVIKTVRGVGLPSASDFEIEGPVTLSTNGTNFEHMDKLLPAFRREFTAEEVELISARMETGKTFYIYYTINEGGKWSINPDSEVVNPIEQFDLVQSIGVDGGVYAISDLHKSWVIEAKYVPYDEENEFPKYQFRVRTTKYVFESEKEVRFFYDTNQDMFDPETGKSLQDEIVILKDVNEIDNGAETKVLENDVIFNMHEPYIYADGHQDQRRIVVLPYDPDQDGIPDMPRSFHQVVGNPYNSNNPDAEYLNFNNLVIMNSFIDVDNYRYFRAFSGEILDLRMSTDGRYELGISDPKSLTTADMIIISHGRLTDFANYLTENVTEDILRMMNNVVVYEEPLPLYGEEPETVSPGDAIGTSDKFYQNVVKLGSADVNFVETDEYQIVIGSTQNQNTANANLKSPLHFKWKHYATAQNRIDPSVSNIMDMTLLTDEYYQRVLVWKDENKSLLELPGPPTTEDLRLAFGGLNEFKMLSDQLVFRSGRFKPLFGAQAAPELQATFKVVKIPTTLMNENQIKTEIISAIDDYFSIENWDYGESFYFTELAAYIHQRLSSAVSTVVIVPVSESSQFGNLFQIKAEATELFISTANVTNIEIVANLTETNLRV